VIYQNYHRHSMYSNIRVTDSVVSNEDYAKRAKNLGHGIISSVEHGNQSRYIECHELAKEYGLKFLFGTEAYWVKDRFEKDRSNCHIILLAKNENGRQAINDILSEANITGYYYQPRVDIELILSLPSNDVWVTSACVGGFKYDDADDIFLQFANHFGNNFYFEVQYHDTDMQKELNRRIIDLSNKHNIPIIMGCDSHFIFPEQEDERTSYLNSKNIFYEDENGWNLDYPDGETAYKRFKQQGVLTEPQIKEAMANTNIFLEVEEYTSRIFNKDVKMPTLYPEKTKEEKDQMLIELTDNLWLKEREQIPQDQWEHYKKEIDKEVGIVVDTNHADYFLLNYELIRQSVAKGGVITRSSRGSGSSFFINKLLGFTTVDRISAPVPLIADRFMSRSRILETKSLADIDFNLGNVDIFEQTQKELLGEDHAYPMVAFGTLQPKAAWKMFSRSEKIDFDISNEISGQIDKYNKAIKYADTDEEKESISIYDFINKDYHETFKQSERYLGVIDSISNHACGFSLYDGSIRKEIGLIMIKAKNGKKEHLCCMMDGNFSEKYKFLKNDLLKVSVVETIDKVFKRIGIPHLDSKELLAICKGDQKTWEVYEKGFTLGINQVSQRSTSGRVTKYKPKNISELTAFISAIRPGAKSIFRAFSSREPFSYDIKTLDDIIQTEEFPQSFILYQETQMKILNYAGIQMDQTYEIIKSISKKRFEKIMSYKEAFLTGFKDKVMEEGGTTEDLAIDVSHKVWQIMEDSASYLFGAAHAYCVAIDSLYGAYLKSHYPLEFYEVYLQILEAKGDKDLMAEVKNEAEKAYGIYFPPMKFRQNNKNIALDSENNQITNSLKSIKGFNKALADYLYSLKDIQFNSFIDFLIHVEETGTLSTKIGELIKIQYFEEFGGNGKLIELYDEFKSGKNKYSKKHTEKTKEKRIAALIEMEAGIQDYDIGIKDQMDIERELLGYIQATYPEVDKRNCFVVEVDTKYAPRILLHSLGSGKTQSVKITKALFKHRPLVPGDIICCERFQQKHAVKKIDGEFVEQDEKIWWLSKYEKVNHLFT